MDDLKLIKKYYGENFMHLCRELFPTLLEKEGLLFYLIKNKFHYNKYLYDDIIEQDKVNDFRDYIYSLTGEKIKKEIVVDKSPFELLNDAGYILYECKTEKDIQKFKKYYKKDEELCTFRDNRLETNYVFFAVKKNVDKIKREDFFSPKREDEYGTSVISIQFSKNAHNTLSIKNRYNHTVKNPDATFSNNLDNIIPGLTNSFKKHYNFNISENYEQDFELENYVKAIDGELYKYNYEINNVYYCPDNIIINEFAVMPEFLNKEKYLVFDYFILDLENKIIRPTTKTVNDSFYKDFCFIKKIEILNNKETKGKTIKILFDADKIAIIELDKENRMIKYYNDKIMRIDNNYLKENIYLKEINLPNILEIGNCFLIDNRILEKINLANVRKIGNEFLKWNRELVEVNFPNLISCGDEFLKSNRIINKLELESIEKIGYHFLFYNMTLNKINLPKVKQIAGSFLYYNTSINKVIMPEVEIIDEHFLYNNLKLKELSLPKVKKIGNNFLKENEILEKINLPNIETIMNNFLYSNELIEKIDFPNLKYIHSGFLFNNEKITTVSLPNVLEIGVKFIASNENINKVELPKVTKIGYSFLERNLYLKELYLPEVISIGAHFLYYNIHLNKFIADKLVAIDDYFLVSNDAIKELSFPCLKFIYNGFLEQNNVLEKFEAPKLYEIGDDFLYYNESLKKFDAPKVERIGGNFLAHHKYINQPELKPMTLTLKNSNTN